MTARDIMLRDFGVEPRVFEFCENARAALAGPFEKARAVAEVNQLKVLSAFRKNRVSAASLLPSTGYGYDDAGRDTLEAVYADVFRAEAALVRPQLISGTHAMAVALTANLRPGDELLSPVGAPYDTLLGVIGVRETRGSLAESGVSYRQVDLLPDGSFDYDSIARAITAKTCVITIQRSKGYSFRRSFPVEKIGALIAFIKGVKPGVICLVDNCYGEFVDTIEPAERGADLCVGSLIKNPGGGLAPTGGYIAGRGDLIENAAARLTAPGLGREVGPTLGVSRYMYQGLFTAPAAVAAAVSGAVFAAEVFSRLGYGVCPSPLEHRSDIVQAINMKSPEELIRFCGGIQSAGPVDAYVRPEPWPMPGYDCGVIMAAGTFTQGSSIELSADAPLRPPYTVFLQGGLTEAHALFGVTMALDSLVKGGFTEV